MAPIQRDARSDCDSSAHLPLRAVALALRRVRPAVAARRVDAARELRHEREADVVEVDHILHHDTHVLERARAVRAACTRATRSLGRNRSLLYGSSLQ
jgi:hypothetical protein